jgi:hypothetical protein
MKHANDLLTIGELAGRTGLAVSAIRFYEARGLVRSLRTRGNQRRFPRSDIRRLSFALIAQRLGLTLDDLLRTGFILLAENPPREILLGVVGKFWTSSGCIQKLNAEGFRAFEQSGYAKAVWNFSLSERETNFTTLATETRIRCMDDDSRRRFRMYWSLIGPFSGMIRKENLRIVRRQAESSWLAHQASQKNQ